ncbi:MAG: hypothetical protein ACRECF_05450 [Methyloceanibacter sp.]
MNDKWNPFAVEDDERRAVSREEEIADRPCPDYGPAGAACRNCSHWVGLARYRWQGECHLRAPFHDGWPNTQDWDWCAEHEPLPELDPRPPKQAPVKTGCTVIDLKSRRPAA